MSAAKIILPNLRAEMARKNVSVMDIAEAIHTGRDTAGGKLSGNRPLLFFEAITITDTFFPNEDVRHLFSLEEKE